MTCEIHCSDAPQSCNNGYLWPSAVCHCDCHINAARITARAKKVYSLREHIFTDEFPRFYNALLEMGREIYKDKPENADA